MPASLIVVDKGAKVLVPAPEDVSSCTHLDIVGFCDFAGTYRAVRVSKRFYDDTSFSLR